MLSLAKRSIYPMEHVSPPVPLERTPLVSGHVFFCICKILIIRVIDQVCVACTDSRAATCKEDGSSLTW